MTMLACLSMGSCRSMVSSMMTCEWMRGKASRCCLNARSPDHLLIGEESVHVVLSGVGGGRYLEGAGLIVAVSSQQ
jgi:hypothetical protein